MISLIIDRFPYKRETEGDLRQTEKWKTQTHRGAGSGKMEAGIGVMSLS